MKVVVDTRSGYGLRFANKLGLEIQLISDPIDKPCILITRNTGLGKIPETTRVFLDTHAALVKGVVVNGMKRYGPFFCKAADRIKHKYSLPIIKKIELDGTDEDVADTLAFLKNIEPDF